ncbi:MAG: phosphoribosylanthranilate isomerase [Pirellulales bacterium]|nr:phosphoribosylanthranilate isomerase [Pirellulales bacterium]
MASNKNMFQVKICGITNEADAKDAVEIGTDALGMNFYPKSPRFITPETAAGIIEAIPRAIIKVGVFVNETAELVAKTFDALGLDLIQLHGDETPEYLVQLGNRPVMKAFRLTPEGLPPIENFLRRTGFQPVVEGRTGFQPVVEGRTGFQPVVEGRTGFQPVVEKRQVGNLSYVLIDSHVEGIYGGSGVPADWELCAKFARNPQNPPLVLAGGLTTANITHAIRTVRPNAVDTASGVETAPGRKDRDLMAAFVEKARAAFLSKDG